MLGIAFNTCNAIISYIFFSTFFEQKKGWRPLYITLLIVSIGVANNTLTLFFEVLSRQFGLARFVLSAIKMYGMFLATTIPLHGRFKKKALLGVLLFVVSQIAYAAAALVYTEQLVTIIDARGVALSLSYLLLFSVIHFTFVSVIRFRKKKIEKSGGGQETPERVERAFALELVVPSMSLAALYYLSFTRPPQESYYGLFLLVINVACFLIYGQMEQFYRQNQRYALYEQEQQYKEEHYANLEAHQAEVRTIKHDIKNQLIAMGAFVTEGEPDRADAQLSELIAQLEESGKYTFTEHAGVNGLLTRKYRQAQGAGIQCDFLVALPSDTGFSDVDLTDLMGNILDNALEACLYTQGSRYIHLEIDCHECVFLLKCTNSTDGQVNSLKTRKRDAGRHGIGMQSIKQVVEKYNGDMKYSFGQDYFAIELSMFCSTLYKNEPG